MGTLETNPDGFDANSPINFTDMMKDNSMLLVHGTGDDNVHFQNSAELINALVRSNKQFDLMVYPDRNHGIYGGKTRYHLYKKMTDYILETCDQVNGKKQRWNSSTLFYFSTTRITGYRMYVFSK